jgi:hypothetical protein
MLHLRYFRVERDRLDHVTLLMPDTGSIPNFSPTADDYQKLVQEILPEQLKQKISQIDAEPFIPQSEAAKKVQAVLDNKESNGTADEMPNKSDEVDASMDNADSTAESLDQSTTEQMANSEVQYQTNFLTTMVCGWNSQLNGVIFNSHFGSCT